MNLYLISQNVECGYDTYDSVVVAAESEDDARNIHPDYPDFVTHVKGNKWMGTYTKSDEEYDNDWSGSWPRYCDIGKIKVRYLGSTNQKRGVILASFNAG